jgi:hypothetical protein
VAWFADLAVCTYFEDSDPEPIQSFGLLAIGWLERGHEYTHGAVDERVRARLIPLIQHVWSPFQYLGGHPCHLCLDSGGHEAHAIPGHPNSFLNLLIPGNGCVYASPELIGHYIDVHEYAPPEEFCIAVLACPPMWSDAYIDALRANGTPRLQSMIEESAEWMEGFREHMLQRSDVPGVSRAS